MVIGGLEVQLTDAISFSYIATNGDAGSMSEMYSHTIVLEMELRDRLDYSLQADYISEVQIIEPVVPMTGITQYMNYQLTDSVDLGIRYEWLQFLDEVDISDLTLGLAASVTPNLLIRPELRWDYEEVMGGGLNDFMSFGIDAIFSY